MVTTSLVHAQDGKSSFSVELDRIHREYPIQTKSAKEFRDAFQEAMNTAIQQQSVGLDKIDGIATIAEIVDRQVSWSEHVQELEAKYPDLKDDDSHFSKLFDAAYSQELKRIGQEAMTAGMLMPIADKAHQAMKDEESKVQYGPIYPETDENGRVDQSKFVRVIQIRSDSPFQAEMERKERQRIAALEKQRADGAAYLRQQHLQRVRESVFARQAEEQRIQAEQARHAQAAQQAQRFQAEIEAHHREIEHAHQQAEWQRQQMIWEMQRLQQEIQQRTYNR